MKRKDGRLALKAMAVCAAAMALMARAQTSDEGEADPPPAESKAEAAGAAQGSLRDPFWPVGYTPPKAAPKEEPAANSQYVPLPSEDQIAWPPLKVKGIVKTSTGVHMAIIETVGAVKAGDIVKIIRENLVFRFLINEIRENGITHTRLDVRQVR